MDAKKKEAIMECSSFDELLNAEYGERGTEAREAFEVEAETFCLAECLKEQRRLAGLTQEQLASSASFPGWENAFRLLCYNLKIV